MNNILLIDRYITERVYQLRKDKKIKVKNLAELLNVEERFIRKIESYKNKYNIHHLVLLSSYFKVSIESFFPNKENFQNIVFNKNYNSFEEMEEEIREEIILKRKKIEGGNIC